MSQSIINLMFAGIGGLGGWIMKIMWDSLNELKTTDRELANKVQSIELLVAGEYVKKDYLERIVERLFSKLDAIEDKVNCKEDKRHP